MNKAELIAKIAEESKLTKKAAEAALVRQRAARKGRNPQTKAEIKIPASKAPVFKAGKALKELVNKK